MLAAWSIVGILYYWFMFEKDKDYRFGKSTVMWILMLFLLFFSTNVWIRLKSESAILVDGKSAGAVNKILVSGSLVQLVVILIALFIVYRLFVTMLRREKEMEYALYFFSCLSAASS